LAQVGFKAFSLVFKLFLEKVWLVMTKSYKKSTKPSHVRKSWIFFKGGISGAGRGLVAHHVRNIWHNLESTVEEPYYQDDETNQEDESNSKGYCNLCDGEKSKHWMCIKKGYWICHRCYRMMCRDARREVRYVDDPHQAQAAWDAERWYVLSRADVKWEKWG
jgi:hypothetical protein